jgi:hypothetical protein
MLRYDLCFKTPYFDRLPSNVFSVQLLEKSEVRILDLPWSLN